MDIFIDDLITKSSFLHFEIGTKLNIGDYTFEIDYTIINNNCYYFYNQGIDVEVSLLNGVIHSFDVLPKNQENRLFLGSIAGESLNLAQFFLDDFLRFLNATKLEWQVEKIDNNNVCYILYGVLTMRIYVDLNGVPSVALLNLS